MQEERGWTFVFEVDFAYTEFLLILRTKYNQQCTKIGSGFSVIDSADTRAITSIMQLQSFLLIRTRLRRLQ